MFSHKSNVVSLANQKYDFNQWDGFTFKTNLLTTAAYRDKMTDIIIWAFQSLQKSCLSLKWNLCRRHSGKEGRFPRWGSSPYTVSGLSLPVPPEGGNLTLLCAAANRSLVLIPNLGAPISFSSREDLSLLPCRSAPSFHIISFQLLMNINYNTENWIKSLYKNEKLASHVSCAHGWKPFPQEKDGDIPPPLGLMSGVEAFSLAVKRAQRAQTAHLSTGTRSTGWIQPFAPPLCLNASVKSWTLMFVKPFKDNNRQEQPANSLHLHCSVLMCTLQLILMSRGWLIFRRKANLYPEFAPAKTPHWDS